jgi:hypothetical protein
LCHGEGPAGTPPAWNRESGIKEEKTREEEPVMSDSRNEQTPINEDGPGVNGDLGSWLYVLGGIPMMIIFFVVLFTLVRLADARNIMIPA